MRRGLTRRAEGCGVLQAMAGSTGQVVAACAVLSAGVRVLHAASPARLPGAGDGWQTSFSRDTRSAHGWDRHPPNAL